MNRASDSANLKRLHPRPAHPTGQDLSSPETATALARWRPLLTAWRLDAPGAGRLAVWLPASVEAEIDAAFARSPSLALDLDQLASDLVMAGLAALTPEAARFGCAPLPPPAPEADAPLAGVGLARLPSGALARRYAVLTIFPFRPDCRACLLHPDCPHRREAGGASGGQGALPPAPPPGS